MRMKKSQEIPIDYACNACSYSTHIKKDYTKHLLTRKHKNRTDPNIIIHPDTPFECPACAKGYTSRNSLWYHKKKCVAFYNKTVSDALTNEAIIDISETGEIDGSGGDEVHTNTVIELTRWVTKPCRDWGRTQVRTHVREPVQVRELARAHAQARVWVWV